nr:hypothetical protein [Tanacetum cinerariifolium]
MHICVATWRGKRIVNGQIGQEDIPAAEDISSESTLVDDNIDKAPKEQEILSIEDAATIETQVDSSNIESIACPSEDIPAAEDISSESTLVDDNIDKAPKEQEILSIEDAATIETQVDSSNIESIACPSEKEVDAESQTESEDIQSVEDRSSLSKASYIIEEGATEDTESTPNLDLEKEEKDNELISEVQSTPKALPKMRIKGEHPEATDEKFETLTGGELREKVPCMVYLS